MGGKQINAPLLRMVCWTSVKIFVILFPAAAWLNSDFVGPPILHQEIQLFMALRH